MSEFAQTWNFWRGSPELLAQVARVAMRLAAPAASPTASCVIDVEVEGDHEIFYSPDDFTEGVTPETLTRFKRVSVAVSGDGVDTHVDLHWNRPWWKPGYGPDADVVLNVKASDEDDAKRVFDGAKASLARGGARVGSFRTNAIVISVWLLLLAAVASALYLLGYSKDVVAIVTACSLPLLVFGLAVGTWMYPALEIAPNGQTRLRVILKFLIPIASGLILAGVKKLLN